MRTLLQLQVDDESYMLNSYYACAAGMIKAENKECLQILVYCDNISDMNGAIILRVSYTTAGAQPPSICHPESFVCMYIRVSHDLIRFGFHLAKIESITARIFPIQSCSRNKRLFAE